MSLVLNISGAAKSALVDGVMFSFYPGILKTVDDKAFAKLREIPLIKRGLDSGDLITQG